MKVSLALALSIMMLFAVSGFSQSAGDLTGNVKDSDSGDPIVGASVVILSTGKTVTTDNDGKYMLKDARDGETVTIRVSHDQYHPVIVNSDKVHANHRQGIDISMHKKPGWFDKLILWFQGSVHLEMAVEGWVDRSGFTRRVCQSDVIRLPEGETDSPEIPDWTIAALRIQKLNPDNTIVIAFDSTLQLRDKSGQFTSTSSPVTVGPEWVCIGTPTVGAGSNIYFRTVDDRDYADTLNSWRNPRDLFFFSVEPPADSTE